MSERNEEQAATDAAWQRTQSVRADLATEMRVHTLSLATPGYITVELSMPRTEELVDAVRAMGLGAAFVTVQRITEFEEVNA